MNHLYVETPLRHSPMLDAKLGKKLHFKLETYQPTRSFKLRGMDYLVRERTGSGVDRFISASGGNAGLSLAYACMRYGAYLKVFVPETTPASMIERIRHEGAVVEVVGKVWDEAHQAAADEAIRTHSYYVSPFDDALLWHGHSTMIEECVGKMDQPDLVVLAVGGGGLLSGVMEGLEKVGWESTRVLAMETEGAASYKASVHAGKVVDFGPIHTVARSLGARKVAQHALELSLAGRIRTETVSDEEAMRACIALSELFQVIVEPACGAAMAAALVRPELLGDAQNILMIACGGAGVSMSDFKQLL